MPVEISEYIKVVDENKKEHVGILVSGNIAAIVPDGEEKIVYGVAKERVKIHTKIVCDNDKCENSSVGPDLVTHTKTIEFDEDGTSNAESLVKEIGEIIVVSDYKGEKKVFCSKNCYRAFAKHGASVIQMPSGKGTRTYNNLEGGINPLGGGPVSE